MDLNNVLGALNQGLETAALARVQANAAAAGRPTGMPPAAAPDGSNIAQALGAQSQGAQQQVVNAAQAAVLAQTVNPTQAANLVQATNLTPTATQPAQRMGAAATLATNPTASGRVIDTDALARAGNSLAAAATTARVVPPATALASMADVYHGSSSPASPSLLQQSGVNAYLHLLNALSSTEHDQKSADQLTHNLGHVAAALKTAYLSAVTKLSEPLLEKDWGFSVDAGKVVITQGKDVLTGQDRADLTKALASVEIESAANDVADLMTSLQARQRAGADPGSLAWGRTQVDETNFSTVVNLRSYVTGTAPGGNYAPNTPNPPHPHQPIPNILGGMDLREMVSARSRLIHPEAPSLLEELDAVEKATKPGEQTTLHGKCSCGEVRFSVDNVFEYAFYCHCSRCRARTGSAFAAIAGIGIGKVQITAGTESLLLEGECSDGYGARCTRCHSFLFAAVRERQYMHVSLGVLDGTPNHLPDHHIYVGSKAPWYRITDGLPQYDELPD